MPYTPPGQKKDVESASLRDVASRAKTKLDDIRSIKSQIAMLRKLMKGGQLKRILKCPFCKCPRLKPLHRRRGMPNW